jgi:hypothetical protein
MRNNGESFEGNGTAIVESVNELQQATFETLQASLGEVNENI